MGACRICGHGHERAKNRCPIPGCGCKGWVKVPDGTLSFKAHKFRRSREPDPPEPPTPIGFAMLRRAA
jgi:hypothetical protein